MSELFEDDGPDSGPSNAYDFTVSELSGAVKKTVEGTFGNVRVRGEIGRVSRPRSGHLYLDLKDDRSTLASVIWKGTLARLAHQPEEGMEVVATGRMTTFPGQSKYQLVIERIEPAGMGALMAMLEKRRAALAAEGLFDEDRKRPIPYLPEVIGVVTSPSGAVIRDILHRLRDRFPRKVLVWPVAVQGQACAGQVAAAIEGFNRIEAGGRLPRPDVLIVARGGGSLEDLWGFNEEAVVRAAASSSIPLISAVGHETDTTLIDHAADRRAPTPTAAAEMAVPVRLDLVATLDGQGARLSGGFSRYLSWRSERVRDLSRALPRPERLVESPRQRLDHASHRLPAALSRGVTDRRARLADAAAALRPAGASARVTAARDRLTQADRLRPALTRNAAAQRRTLREKAARLRPDPILHAVTRNCADLGRIWSRLAAAAGALRAERVRHLAALDRTRLTLGPSETLARGFAIVRTGEGKVVTTREAAAEAGALELEFRDGRLPVGGPGAASTGAAMRPAKPARRKTPPPDDDQGSLL
ncbi:exodeoxyribonuclease VII large subunit [Roseicyclus sp. F158]|uniref:Exodeoxyribonuclease 7 large subunit n=1 Tax=Tropicimonas omnivorans TaxID=3075590 RepID=A0ABU3DF92_9RHOB|nr:exodeoxyribonuclease VII large subunit [Roseicyclus sp. F158]MDT0682352.1 exodeoxyribonuclease VII large subunit [Roseicyclus sp. F158]